MNINQLSYIIKIASSGSLSAAAQQLGISQPALSKYLAKLEQEVGMELFFRSKKRLYPTPAGRLYLKTAPDILDLYERTHTAVAELDTPPTMQLRFGISPHRGAILFSSIYPNFHRRYPSVQLVPYEGYAHELKDKLSNGELDMIFTSHLGSSPTRLRTIPLLHEEVVVAMPKIYRLFHHEEYELDKLPYINLSELQNSVFIMPTPSSALYDSIEPYFKQHNFSPQVYVSTPNVIMEVSMIRSGAGIGLIPSHYVCKDNDLAFFRLPGAPVMPVAFLFLDGHTLTEWEQYLVYLILKDQIRTQNKIMLWTDELRRIMWKFDPIESENLHLEATQ